MYSLKKKSAIKEDINDAKKNNKVLKIQTMI